MYSAFVTTTGKQLWLIRLCSILSLWKGALGQWLDVCDVERKATVFFNQRLFQLMGIHSKA